MADFSETARSIATKRLLLSIGTTIGLLVSQIHLGLSANANDLKDSVTYSSLPYLLADASAVQNNKTIYVFGGREDGRWTGSTNILKIDAQDGVITFAGSSFTSPRRSTNAVLDPGTGYAYIFAGYTGDDCSIPKENECDSGIDLTEILRFDTQTESIETVGNLPVGGRGGAAVWSGDSAYVFLAGQVIRFTPGSAPVTIFSMPERNSCELAREKWKDNATSTSTTIPAQTLIPCGLSAVAYNDFAYVFGGPKGQTATLKIGPLSSCPAICSVSTLPQADIAYDVDPTVPNVKQRDRTAAAILRKIENGVVRDKAYVFGGCCADGFQYRHVTEFDFATERLSAAKSLPAPANPHLDAAPLPGEDPTVGLSTFSATSDGSLAYLIGGENYYHPQLSRHVQTYSASLGPGKLSASLPWEHFSKEPCGGTHLCSLSGSARYDAGAVWAGETAYVFGGTNRQHRFSQIVRYVPGRGATPASVARLIEPVSNAAVVWDPRKGEKECPKGCAYIFGGWKGGASFSSGIYRFDPAASESDAISTAGALGSLWGTTGAFDGKDIYLFGGDTYIGYWTNRILRYTPATQQVTRMSSSLPGLRTDAMAVWATHVGGCELGCIYVIGGRIYGFDSRIIRYIPALDGLPGAITVMNSSVPRWRAASVWDGRHIYTFGGLCQVPRNLASDPSADCMTQLNDGYWGNRAWDSILRYDPILDQVSTILDPITTIDRLPRAQWAAPAACDKDTVHFFGGSYATSEMGGGGQNDPIIGDYYRAESDSDSAFTDDISHYKLPSLLDEVLGAVLSILPPQVGTLVPDEGVQLLLNLQPPCRDLLGNLVFRVFEVVQDGQNVVEEQIALVQEEAARRIEDIYQIVASVDPCKRAKYRVQVENSTGEILARTATVPPPIEIVINCPS